jgi:hypothetical protein
MSQVDHLTAALHRLEDDNRSLMAEIETDRSLNRKRHNHLIDELARSISVCDASVSIIRRLYEFESEPVRDALQVLILSSRKCPAIL